MKLLLPMPKIKSKLNISPMVFYNEDPVDLFYPWLKCLLHLLFEFPSFTNIRVSYSYIWYFNSLKCLPSHLSINRKNSSCILLIFETIMKCQKQVKMTLLRGYYS